MVTVGPPPSDHEIPELRDQPAVMTPAQVAEVLQMNNQVVRKKLNAGEWPGFRVGIRDWRMRRLVVQAIITGTDPWAVQAAQEPPPNTKELLE